MRMTAKVTTASSSPKVMSFGLTLLFAIAAGASVGNLYWAQPLLAPIADSFAITSSDAGLVITLSQIGYAIGVFFIVPLGDSINRRRIIPIIMFLTSMALAATAFASSFSILLVVIAIVGFSTVSGQILTPLAGDIASEEQRGRVLGVVASGLMLGILLSRAASGLIAELFGWRAVFMIAAIIMLVLSLIVYRYLPNLEPRPGIPYRQLLVSVLSIIIHQRRVQITVLLGALPMSVFTLFWTGLTLLLSNAPFAYSTGQIGLIGLLAIVGAAAALGAGRLYDRGLSLPAIGCGLILALIALSLSGFGQNSIIANIIAIILFSIGLQTVLVLAQTRMMAINPQARSRLNTIYVVGNFIAGAIGSAIAGILWKWGGWSSLMWVGCTILLLALIVWVFELHHASINKKIKS